MFKSTLKAPSDRLERWIAPLLLMALLITLLLVAPTPGGLGEQSAQAAGNTIYVDAGATSGADNGTSWADAFTTLQPALDAAVAGDEIWVAAGTYHPTVEHGGTGDRFRSFQMKNGVAIYGGFSGMEISLEERDWVLRETVLSGDIGIESDPTDNCYHVFYHPDGSGLNSTAILDGFTISDGIANGGGEHANGGGMYNDGSSPTLVNCVFAANEADADAVSNGDGGGMYNRDSSSPTLIDCTFTGNSAGYGGGGIYSAYGSSPTLINCVFAGNWSQWFGGGMHNHICSPTLINCTFAGNVAQNDLGGGMHNSQASANLINCTFFGNVGGKGGGAIDNRYSSYYGIPTTLANCILWGDSPNEIENYSSTTLAVYSDIQGGYTGEGNINADPLFVDPANGDFHLGAGSPCIDTGDNSADDLPGLDFEGDARIMDGNTDGIAIVDMGVDEIGTPADCQARINDDAVVYTNVQSAVDAAGGGDLIKVAGYCAGAQSRDGVTQTVYLSKTLTIQGGYTTTNWIAPNPESNPTTLHAQGQGRVLYITGNISPTIEGLRITGGDAAGQGGSPWGSDSGGGVYVVDATATISDCTVLGNDAGLSGVGGGLYLLRSDSTLSGNTIEGNTADDPLDGYGGGLYLRESPALLRDNTVTANSANNDGGGIYLDMSDANLSGNTIIFNHANSNGGGLHLCENSNAIIESNTIVSNTAHLGGGMSIYYSPATVTGNEVRGNDAYAGGGAYLLYSESELTQNTFSFNSASWSGGGVHLMVSISTFSNNQVLSNTADFGGGLSLVGDTAMLAENIIKGNIANHTGGGIHLSETNPSVSGNVISDNTANLTGDWQGGGGMFLDVCHGTFEGNTIVDNSAMNGGGLYLHANSNSTFRNNVIAGNNAGNIGSGLYVSESHPELVHTTLALNQGGEGSAVLVASGSSLAMTNTILVSHTTGISVSAGGSAHLDGTLWGAGHWANGTDWAGDGTILTGTTNIFADPQFVDAGSGDYHIQPESAAIDAGVDSGVIEDIDGDPRPQGTGYDIGADETESPASGTLNLTVDLQGRTDDSGTLFTAWSGGEEAGNCTSASDGTCSIELPTGVYSVTADMTSYLCSIWDSVSISEGESVTLPTVTLLGGDTNDDCVINIQDLSFIGYRFNACVGDPLYDARGDITADGCINILDLTMAGANWGRSCPVPW